MANPEHLAILNQGVEVWNNWRNENLDVRPDLSAANLSGADLSDANLRRANLMMADLSEANLSRANLQANLIGANLTRADLSGATLKANLTWANLSAANLSGANLTMANLTMANLRWANFHNAILTGACIKDWDINSKTKLDQVICEYVNIFDYHKCESIQSFHLSNEEYISRIEIRKKESRRPINGNFAPGEFASLYKKILENADLILRKTPENDNTSNNQGVQFYSDSTIHTWERLRFRSKTEIKIAEALDRTGVLFVPNSLARLTTPKGRENKEADFLICYNGKWGVLEVDGPFHTAERRVEEQERERIFKKNGIKVVERFDSERCYNNPDEVVQEFFKMIDIGYS